MANLSYVMPYANYSYFPLLKENLVLEEPRKMNTQFK